MGGVWIGRGLFGLWAGLGAGLGWAGLHLLLIESAGVPSRLQILAYKEDFAWERADRERAQSRAQALEEKLACLQRAGRQVWRFSAPRYMLEIHFF